MLPSPVLPGLSAARVARRARRPLAVLGALALSTGLAACQGPAADAAAPTGPAPGSASAADPAEDAGTGASQDPAGAGSAEGGGDEGGQDPAGTGSTDGSAGGSSGGGGSNGSIEEEVPQGLQPFYDRQVAWGACEDVPGASEGYECATVQVPLDYDDPAGQAIDLALMRLPASGQSRGSLFLNPGGPGGSGIDLLQSKETLYPAGLREAYDIVGFDPRGVRRSTPLECMSREDALQAVSEQVVPEPADDLPPEELLQEAVQPGAAEGSSVAAVVEAGRATAAACREHSAVPEIIDHMDTRSVARDLDVLRAQVGDDKLSYLGYSYGTFLGATYADLFPSRVGRMVLDSAFDPSLQLDDVRDAQTASFQASLTSFVAYWQERGDSPLTGTPEEGVAQLAEFVQSLDEDPVTDPATGAVLSRDVVAAVFYNVMYSDATWDSFAAALGPLVTDRDPAAFLELVRAMTPPRQPEEQAAVLANGNAAYAVNCLDYPVRGDQAQWEAKAAERARVSPIYGAVETIWNTPFCSGWGSQAVREPAAVTAEGADPILVLGVTEDPATPYPWAQALADQLDSGHLLTVQGKPHGAFLNGRSPDCVDTAVTAYLLDGTLPDEGAGCSLPGSGAAAGGGAG